MSWSRVGFEWCSGWSLISRRTPIDFAFQRMLESAKMRCISGLSHRLDKNRLHHCNTNHHCSHHEWFLARMYVSLSERRKRRKEQEKREQAAKQTERKEVKNLNICSSQTRSRLLMMLHVVYILVFGIPWSLLSLPPTYSTQLHWLLPFLFPIHSSTPSFIVSLHQTQCLSVFWSPHTIVTSLWHKTSMTSFSPLLQFAFWRQCQRIITSSVAQK